MQSSTWKLLRIPFSYFLLPVFAFAVCEAPALDIFRVLVVFSVLHLLVYPASNGYNSYMDRDTTPIGGLAAPPPPTRQLFWVTIIMDLLALSITTSLLGIKSAALLLLYIVTSRAYSYRGIRLKQYPFIGYLSVVLVQGCLTFWLVYATIQPNWPAELPILPMSIAGLLIGGFYPLTQVYQHEADAADGVVTISRLLGIRGTFLFTALVYAVAAGLLTLHWWDEEDLLPILILHIGFLPVVILFFVWMRQVWLNPSEANHVNMMRMNWVASTCTNLIFFLTAYYHHR